MADVMTQSRDETRARILAGVAVVDMHLAALRAYRQFAEEHGGADVPREEGTVAAVPECLATLVNETAPCTPVFARTTSSTGETLYELKLERSRRWWFLDPDAAHVGKPGPPAANDDEQSNETQLGWLDLLGDPPRCREAEQRATALRDEFAQLCASSQRGMYQGFGEVAKWEADFDAARRKGKEFGDWFGGLIYDDPKLRRPYTKEEMEKFQKEHSGG